MNSSKQVTILGAGLVGSLLSIFLAKKGYQVDIYERRGDMRKEKVAAGRSINLALSERGWKALEKVGITKEIEAVAIPMKGRMIHNIDESSSFQQYGKEGQAIYSVSRGGLNATLMDCAESFKNISIHFNHKCDEVLLKEKKVIFIDKNQDQKIVDYDLLFGADGAYSALRSAMQKKDRFDYSQSYINHGYKELHIPADSNNNFKLEKNALHIWPRKSFMLIALPNLDGSFTCTLFFPFEGNPSFGSLNTDMEVEKFFSDYFPDIKKLSPDYLNNYNHNPTSSLVTVRCFPWAYENSACLIGDAAHAIVPFFGQGMNCGFEDCRILDEIMNDESDWKVILDSFQKSRKENADAIAELALNNFIEMRDLVSDPHFLHKKSIEKKISEVLKDDFISAYGMVSFSNLPYSTALKKGKQQNEVLEKLSKLESINDSDILEFKAALVQ